MFDMRNFASRQFGRNLFAQAAAVHARRRRARSVARRNGPPAIAPHEAPAALADAGCAGPRWRARWARGVEGCY
jgi:hypothetical protein